MRLYGLLEHRGFTVYLCPGRKYFLPLRRERPRLISGGVTMRFSIALVRLLTVGVLMALAGTAGAQQAYPNKTVRIIVPFPPGGSVDVLARIAAQKLSETLGQQFIVDNRGGGSTIIGTEFLVKAKPDGYTIMFMNSAHVTTPLLMKTPYDAIKDFTPISTIAQSQYLMAVHPSTPANNLQEFIAFAKTKPGQISFASSGMGGPAHLTAELFMLAAGIKMRHIPYKGGGPALTDLLGGQVQVGFNVPINYAPHIQAGKLKGMAITGKTRLPNLPQMPTFAEAGLPDYDSNVWFGVLAPAGTPKDIIDKLRIEIGKILTAPELKKELIKQGMETFSTTPEEFAALMKADTEKFANVIKTANIKLEN
jgi:tripartite-type tricarboxylate transporter receptor subunit TctC